MTDRAELWKEADVPMHLRLIDGALDTNDVEHTQFHKGMSEMEKRIRADMAARFDRQDARMTEGFKNCEDDAEGNRKLLVGLLVSIVLAAISTLISVLVIAGGGS